MSKYRDKIQVKSGIVDDRRLVPSLFPTGQGILLLY